MGLRSGIAALSAPVLMLTATGCATQRDAAAGSVPISPTSSAVGAATHAAASASAGAEVSAAVYARLRLMALAMAKTNGDLHPSRMEAVATSDVDHADQVLSGDVVNGAGGAGYVIELQGHFVCDVRSVPAGAKSPAGTVADAIVRAGTFAGEGGGIGNRWTDLHALGEPFSLAGEPTAAPVTVAAETPSPAVTAPVPQSAGPAAPDPTTLAEAEQRARQATTDPTHATIDAASAATAARLRIAGLTIPPSVKSTTTMFVVVVDGTTVLSSGAGQQDAQSPRFAVVFNSDGSGRGDQAVYHSAFGLPDLPNATSPAVTVVDATQLSNGPLSWTPAPAGSLAHAVPVAVALKAGPPAQFPSLAKPIAALVYVTTPDVTHRLAWVIETYGDLIEGGAGPWPNAVGELKSSQAVLDATTGRRLEAASF